MRANSPLAPYGNGEYGAYPAKLLALSGLSSHWIAGHVRLGNGKKGCKCLQKRPTIVLKSQEKNKLRLRIRHSNCLILADGKFAFPDLERWAALLAQNFSRGGL